MQASHWPPECNGRGEEVCEGGGVQGDVFRMSLMMVRDGSMVAEVKCLMG